MLCFKTVLTILAISLFISKQLHASDDLFALSLDELMLVEVSSATYTGDTLSTVPASATVFTAKEIQQLGVRYLHELTNFVPGFQSKRQGDGVHQYSYSSRGRQVGTSTRSVKLIVNGQAWSNSYVGSSVAATTTIPLANVSKVEFVRGPGSVLHGSGAMMGSINIETYQDENYVDMSVGNWQSHSSTLNTAQDGWYISLQQSSSAGDDYQLKDMDSGNYLPANDEYSESHFYATKNTGDLKLAFSHHLNERKGFYSFGRVNESFNARKGRYITLSADYPVFSDSYTELKLHVFSNRLTVNYTSDLSGIGALSALSNPSTNEKSWINANIQANQSGVKLVGDWLQLNGSFTLGAEYLYDEPVENNARSNFDYPALSNLQIPIGYSDGEPYIFEVFDREENHKLSIFSEFEYRLNSTLNSVYSLRYDYAQRTDTYSLSPRLAFVYDPTDSLTLKLLYSEAFRSPDAIELGTKNNPVLVGNENLEPEKIKTSEFILLFQKHNQTLSAAYFYNHIEDGIEQLSLGGSREFVNTGTTYNDGIELEYRIQLSESFRINTSFTHQFKTLDASFRLSDSYGSATFFWQHKKWIGSISQFYHSESAYKFGNDFKPLPSFWHHNASITYFHNKQFESRLTLSNLSNSQYKVAGENANLDEGIPSPGRFTNYTIKIKF